MAERTKRKGKVPVYDGSLDRKVKRCPKCGKSGRVGKSFGVRRMGLVYRAQAWCITCRGSAPAPAPKVKRSKPKLAARSVARKEPATAVYEFEVMDDDAYAAWEAEQINPKPQAPEKPKKFSEVRDQVVIFANLDAPAVTDSEIATAAAPSVGVEVGTDLASTRALYRQVFPKDNQARPWKTMVDRLVKKLGSDVLTEDAALKLAGV